MAKPKTRKPETPEAENLQPVEIVENIRAASDAGKGVEPAFSETEPVSLAEPEPVAAASTESNRDPETLPKPAQEPASPPARRRGGFFPLMAGGVVAAALGAGGVIFAVPRLPAEWRAALLPAAPPVYPAQGPLADALAGQAAQIDALKQALAQLSAAPAGPDLSGVPAAIDEARAAATGAQTAVEALNARVTALENRAPEAAAGPGADVSGLQGQLDALAAQVAQMGSAQSETQSQIAAASAEAAARIAEAETQAAQLRASSEAAARRTLAQAALARLKAAFDAGTGLDPALADLSAAGMTPPAALAADLPSLAQLQAGFADAARNALTAARKDSAGEGLGERLGAFLLAQTGARSLTARDGSDPDAVLSRAQAAVDEGRLGDALQEISALPTNALAALQDWSALAERRLAAAQAIEQMSQSVK